MPNTAASAIHSTTQQFLDIYDITNNILLMKDGATAMILTVDALNFGLLAEEEQDAVMYAYAGLLNSLNYPIQIVIRSQTKDATNYLNLLKEQETKASSQAKRVFISQYREFVSQLIRERNVLDKKFYIAIPATALEMGLLPPSTVVPGVKKIDVSTMDRSGLLDKAKTILEPKRDHLISQFARIGLFARQLQTQEIIQLFYTSYNPEASEGQGITDTRDYTTAVVDAQVAASNLPQQAPQPTEEYQPAPAPVLNQPVAGTQATPLLAENVNSTAIYEEPPAITDLPTAPVLTQPESAALLRTNQSTPVVDPTLTAPVPQEPLMPEAPVMAAPELAPVAMPAPEVAAITAPPTSNVVFSASAPVTDPNLAAANPAANMPPIAEIH